jgi:uncharacterized membrane protein YvbJ
MNCIKCGHKNAGLVGFCGRCGSKLDFTADEIQGALVEKAREEVAQTTEHYAKQALVFAAVVFMGMLTLLVLSTGSPDATFHIPSASNGMTHLQASYILDSELPRMLIPVEPKKK